MGSNPVQPPLITNLRVKHYKSIAAASLQLGHLTVLVGPNGAGKSNLVDALRFVKDALSTTLDHALRDRGGVGEVRRRSTGHPPNFGVHVQVRLGEGRFADYGFDISAQRGGRFAVTKERCRVRGTHDAEVFVEKGEVTRKTGVDTVLPSGTPDRLYLVQLSGQPLFRPVYDALIAMGFYSFNPDAIRELQQPDAGSSLTRDGSNLASVIGRLEREEPRALGRITAYLGAIVPGLGGVGRATAGRLETLTFRQDVAGAQSPWAFSAQNMSDGTLRASGILAALFQPGVPLVGVEEPEAALHPAAAGALYEALVEASRSRQVLLTSHSPDLLDSELFSTEDLLAVQSIRGSTHSSRIAPGERQLVQDQLFTAGELLRLGQLQPEGPLLEAEQLALFP